LLAYPHFGPVIKNFETHAGWLMAFSADKHYVGNRYWCLALNNAGLPEISPGFHVTLGYINAFYQNAILSRVRSVNLALFAAVIPSDNQYFIIFAYLHLRF
jgi:hypothetical protein